jgi:hypothetical protein
VTQPSGAAWCQRFPTSTSLEDLIQPFQGNVEAFIAAIKAARGHVSIAATYRPPERAYLMHWACMIGQGGQDPQAVPAMAGVDIDWTHGGDRAAAKKAAQEMMAGYQIKYPAALVSRHTQRRAIDMGISLQAGAIVKAKNGSEIHIARDCNGTDPVVVSIGQSYGVIKLVSDPPHWSDDGH